MGVSGLGHKLGDDRVAVRELVDDQVGGAVVTGEKQATTPVRRYRIAPSARNPRRAALEEFVEVLAVGVILNVSAKVAVEMDVRTEMTCKPLPNTERPIAEPPPSGYNEASSGTPPNWATRCSPWT